ncbi:hypothetical protein U9M48_005396 [Paspalum notatum var. saurae]|uniref:Uncharacterized protein n=1 Tax=Paspalum notatum var. saurae TaxID=547442 RepID=A0AAQ3PLS7_PASNO
MQLEVDKALKEAVDEAPPTKRLEAEKAALGYKTSISVLLAKAKGTGDEEKALSIASSYVEAAKRVTAVPFDKLGVMELMFSKAATPDRTKCPKVDKPYCETYSKHTEAQKGVLHAASPAKEGETFNVLAKQGSTMFRKINKAYATGDEKEIARVLAAYKKAADAVIAAAPAEKFKVMEEAYTAANKA